MAEMRAIPRPAAVLMLLLCTAIWGFAFVAQKVGMASMGPLTFTGVRFLIGGALILPLGIWEARRRGRPVSRPERGLLLLLCVVFFFGAWLQQWGLQMTTATNGGFLTGLYVLFVPLIALLVLRARPHPILYFCVPAAIAGLYLLNGGGLARLNGGDALVVMSALFWAVHVLTLGYLGRRTGLPIAISALSFLFAGAVSLAAALLFEAPSIAGILSGWPQLLYVAVFSTALAFSLQAVGQVHVPAANAAVILSSESLFAALAGALLLCERLPPVGYLGAGLMFLAIVAVEVVPAALGQRAAIAQVAAARATN